MAREYCYIYIAVLIVCTISTQQPNGQVELARFANSRRFAWTNTTKLSVCPDDASDGCIAQDNSSPNQTLNTVNSLSMHQGIVAHRIARAVTASGTFDSNETGSFTLSNLVRPLNQPPRFPQRNYEALVYENAAPGSLILAVVAINVDDAPIRYALLSSNGQKSSNLFMFHIHSETGVLRLVNKAFTFTDDHFRFRVIAEDRKGFNATASVHVKVVDINDHRPAFLECSTYRPAVRENEPELTPVIKVTAVDEDKGENSAIVYSLVTSPGLAKSQFIINSTTGQLFTNQIFDRDFPQYQKRLPVIVKASDKGTPSLEGTCSFTVNVLDENDNQPAFDKTNYIESVARTTAPGTTLLWLSAADDDTDNNAAIIYQLRPLKQADAGYFRVNSVTGAVTLHKTLNKTELNYEFKLEAIAKDRGSPSLQSAVPVIINVKDPSTRPPTFVHPPNKTYYLPETYRDTETPIARIKAVSHSVLSTKVFYDIADGSPTHPARQNQQRVFGIEEDGAGWALVKYAGSTALDYETAPEYQITVTATTEDQTTAVTQFRIVLLDKNDQVPYFYPVGRALVQENAAIGTYVATVAALDADGTSPNNQITYRFPINSTEARRFAINSTTGRIVSRVQFDREDRSHPSPYYMITVLAEDGAPSDIRNTGRPNIARQRLTVEIGDENDNAPKFDANDEYRAIVRENMDIGSKVLQVFALDPDSASQIRYEITDGNGEATFRIDAETGVIRLARALDYETIQQYRVTVTASDGRYEDSRVVTVTVHNVNDVAPQFERNAYQLKLRENFNSSLPILKVTAVDPDPVGQASIIYKLSGPGIYPHHPEKNLFEINNKGEIRLKKRLDRDEGTGGREVWKLSILAWDDGGRGLGSTVPFTLTLSDVNDNAPYIVQNNKTTAMILENSNFSSIRLPVEADDHDDHKQNGPPYTFQLDPNAPSSIRSKFRVNDLGKNRAEIVPIVKFDREQQKSYRIPILVRDNPGADPAPLSATTFYTVVIGDVNDNNMADGSSIIRVYNFEGKLPDLAIGRAYVVDADDWDLPDKTFSWLPSTKHDGHFRLAADTGTIAIRHATPNGSYPLQVKVYDRKFRSTATANVTVHVKLLPRRAVVQSGSLRLDDTAVDDFVGELLTKPFSAVTRLDLLHAELSRLLKTARHNVEIFSLVNNGLGGIDVRYAAKGSPYYQSERLNGLVAMNKSSLEKSLGVKVVQVGINDCMFESTCRDSCYSTLKIYENEVHQVQTNTSSITGVKTSTLAHCDQCEPVLDARVCLNDGTWNADTNRCDCPPGLDGSNCQGLAISLRDDGYAWLPGLTVCKLSTLTFDLTTESSSGMLLYNGPLDPSDNMGKDFIAVLLAEGRLRVLLNLGADTVEASPTAAINDGRSHRVQLRWQHGRKLRVLLDSCANRTKECHHSVPLASGQRHRQLNVAAWPLQLGGTQQQLQQLTQLLHWPKITGRHSFIGCFRNLTFGNKIYDLSSPAFGDNYDVSCAITALPVTVIDAGHSFLIAFIICLIFIIAIFLLAIAMRRKKSIKQIYKDNMDDIRDTIIEYEYEGGGEKDHTSFDLSVLQVPKLNGVAAANGGVVSTNEGVAPTNEGVAKSSGTNWSTDKYLGVSKSRVDNDLSVLPPDDVRDYAYEGSGSMAGSLSTLISGTTDADLNLQFLERAGDKFTSLSAMYNDPGDIVDDKTTPVDSQTVPETWC